MKSIRNLLLVLLGIGVAGPVAAQSSVFVNNSEVPGSVLVFHKFIRGTVPDGLTGDRLPRSEFEISVLCPTELTNLEAGCSLLPNYPDVKIKFHWVCPGDPTAGDPRVCRGTDFILSTTVNGTIRINPENLGGRTHNVATPGCEKGYLIAWVIGTPIEPVESLEVAIKFDGLIGDAILRHDATSASAYNPVPIQASEFLTTGFPTDDDFDGNLDFNGFEYKEVSDRFIGTVRYNDASKGIKTSLTLLTLDVDTNRPNGRTFVDLNFYNEAEVGVSTDTNFVCWQQVKLTHINEGLNTSFGTKGLVQSRGARQEDLSFPESRHDVTLLAIIETTEAIPGTSGVGGNPPGTFFLRSYAYSVYNDGQGQSTEFEPKEEPVITGPGFLPLVPFVPPVPPLLR
jgi:hypothetical protein